MIDYDDLPTVEMALDEFNKLEDRSMCLGDDRVPGKKFRANLRIFGKPEWVLGTFYEDTEQRREDEESARKFAGSPLSESLFSSNWIKIRWERVVFTDDQRKRLSLFERLKAK